MITSFRLVSNDTWSTLLVYHSALTVTLLAVISYNNLNAL